MKKSIVACISILLLVFVSAASAKEFVVAEKTFTRGTGEPVIESWDIDIQGIGGPGVLKVINGAEDSDIERVSSSTISLNSSPTFDSSNFNQNVSSLTADVNLNEGLNTIEVLLKSKPGGQIKVQIIKDVIEDSAVILGSEGGIIEFTDPSSPLNGIKINIPAKALDRPIFLTMSIKPLSNELPDEVLSAGPVINFGPDGTIFSNAITISIPYNDHDNDGFVDGTNITENNLCALFYDIDMGRWLYLKKVGLNTEKNIITFETNHFTDKAVGAIDTSNCGRDDVAFFTIDGCALGTILTIGSEFNARPAYLKPALINSMNLDLKDGDVYSYGGGPGESWSGESNDTEYIVPNLVNVLRSQYNMAHSVGKKFVMVTHSWGTVLAYLTLSYCPQVDPDLLITLSSPLGTQYMEDNLGDVFVSGPFGLYLTVEQAQSIVHAYVRTQMIETLAIFANVGRYPINPDFFTDPDKEWFNYWAMGDVFSGPLKSVYTEIEDNKGKLRNFDYINRTFGNTFVWHAITSLDNRDNGSWDKWLNDSYRDVAKAFMDIVEKDIRYFLAGSDIPSVTTFNIQNTSINYEIDSVIAQYSVEDPVDLNRVELWRAVDLNGQPADNWNMVTSEPVSGTSATGTINHDNPSLGLWWYGIHAVNEAGKWAAESTPIQVFIYNNTSDFDNDSLSDIWEKYYGLDPIDDDMDDDGIKDGDEDPDQDGYTNLQEYQAGTNPTDFNSYPTVTAFLSGEYYFVRDTSIGTFSFDGVGHFTYEQWMPQWENWSGTDYDSGKGTYTVDPEGRVEFFIEGMGPCMAYDGRLSSNGNILAYNNRTSTCAFDPSNPPEYRVAFKKGDNYQLSSLSGEYNFINDRWIGTFTFDGAGSFTYEQWGPQWENWSGQEYLSGEGTYSVDPEGRIQLFVDGDVTCASRDGRLSADGNILAYNYRSATCAFDLSNPPEYRVAFKKGDDYQLSSLSGEYHVIVDKWIGTLSFDGAGNITYEQWGPQWENWTDSTYLTGNCTYTVDPEGNFDMSCDGDPSCMARGGRLSHDGNILAYNTRSATCAFDLSNPPEYRLAFKKGNAIPIQRPDYRILFYDQNLESAVREVINKQSGDIMYSDIQGITQLDLSDREIYNIYGLHHFVNLTDLNLQDNQIYDIRPLIDNKGLGEGDVLDVSGNPLSYISCNEYISALNDRKVTTYHSCPLIEPVVSVSPTQAWQHSNFDQSGSGFTPYSNVTLYFIRPELGETTLTVYADSSGNYVNSWYCDACPVGEYTYWAVDGATGIQSNIVTFTVTAAAVDPEVSVSPTSGPQGTIFHQTGTGFTLNSTATLHFIRPGLGETTLTVYADIIGTYANSWYCDACPIGEYTYWAVDDSTGIQSNIVTFTVTAVDPEVSVSPTSGPQGTTFHQPGFGFTPNSTATLHFIRPGLGETTLIKNTDSSGKYSNVWTCDACPIGEYTYWTVDDSTGLESNTVTFAVY